MDNETITYGQAQFFKEPLQNCFFRITVIETIAVTVVLIAIIIVKLFFADSFSALQKLYRENFYEDTTVSEVLMLESEG